MLYDGNFRLDKSEDILQPLEFSIVELIRRNEEGKLDNRHKLVPIILRHVKELDKTLDRHVIMALPFGGNCFYCLTDNKAKRYDSGGFVYDNDALFFAKNMINLSQDRDGYRQNPTAIKGNYYTDSSFKAIIEQFQQAQVPLFRTTNEVVYYDKKSWPDKSIPNLGEMSYSEAFKLLEKY